MTISILPCKEVDLNFHYQFFTLSKIKIKEGLYSNETESVKLWSVLVQRFLIILRRVIVVISNEIVT